MRPLLILLATLPLLLAAAPALVLLSPLPHACISSPFGPRAIAGHGIAMHNGVDLPAPAGAWVRAAAPGTVARIGRRGASGLMVELRHADGTRTRYAHLGSVTPALAGGRRHVALGERLGRVGRTGTTRGTHLHFELHATGRPVNPAPALGLAPCPAAAERG